MHDYHFIKIIKNTEVAWASWCTI